jgi:lipopolysaccharide export LptBFGC system permease protein LptF
MSTPARRPPQRLSRKQREQRAYALVLAGGAGAVLTVVLFIVAAIGAVGFGLPFLAAVFTALCAWAFKRSVSR